ncbi:putative protein MIZU-KUSSEI 1-like, plant [Lupinus albus]|uniref:Uncharacterized protein n=1 Tax=Lupinus albus TaxID=3870 RepID=A0A6A4NKR7_LUPAL|nr:putative protein MIZU-KUSSEI 1-like, plant [Lupinus albus]
MPTVANEAFIHGGTKIKGTLFGHKRARINLTFQESPKCLPFLLLESAIPTRKLLRDMGVGLIRIALEYDNY